MPSAKLQTMPPELDFVATEQRLRESTFLDARALWYSSNYVYLCQMCSRDGPHGIGSVQLYIRHNQESHFFVQREIPAMTEQLQRMCVFDVAANNADRKGGHCLLDERGTIWGIDHGLCFHPQYKLRSVIW